MAFGFGLVGLAMVPVACGASASHPSAIITDTDGNFVPIGDVYVPPPDSAEAAIPDGAPTTVAISSADQNPVTSISFGEGGFVNCGSAARSAPVTILNTGNAPLSWSASLSAGASHYTLSPSSGTVAGGQSATLQVIPAAIPQQSEVTPDLYGGVLTIQTSAANDTTHVVQLHQTARGVILRSTLGTSLDFRSQAVNQPASSQFSLTNGGNVAATVNLAVGSAQFTVTPPSGSSSIPFVIGPNGTAAPTLVFTPNSVSSFADTLITSVVIPDGGTTALCGLLPPTTALAGSGNNTVFISPTNLDFGLTDCSKQAAPQTLVLQNKGALVSYKTAFTKGGNSPYVVSPTGPGTIPANQNLTFTITPNVVPKPSKTDANYFGDTLTITTDDGSGPALHAVTLNQTARGAILQFSPTTVTTTGGTGGAGRTQFANFAVSNAGNYEGTFLLGPAPGAETTAVTQTAGSGTWSSNVFDGNLVGGGSKPAVLSVINPTPPFQALGHITLTIKPNVSGQPTILCADPPPDLELSAQ